MREILSISMGKAGSNVALKMWQKISFEHGILPSGTFSGTNDQMEGLQIYFQEDRKNLFKPRAILADLDPSTIHVIRERTYNEYFHPHSLIFGDGEIGSHFGRAYFTEGKLLVEQMLDQICSDIEQCDCPQGFEIFHSLGGGTGAGVTSLLAGELSDLFPNRIITSFSIAPSAAVKTPVVEPYNCILSLNKISNLNATFLLDNEVLLKTCLKTLHIQQPSYKDFNKLIAETIAGISQILRFPYGTHWTLQKMHNNLIPYKNLHFLLTSNLPKTLETPLYMSKVSEFIDHFFEGKDMMVNVNPKDGKYLAVYNLIRSKNYLNGSEIRKIKNELNIPEQFVNYIPFCSKTIFNYPAPCDSFPISGTFLANNTSVRFFIQRMVDEFIKLYNRKYFLQWYLSHGIEGEDFIEAYEHIMELLEEYRFYETTEADLQVTEEKDENSIASFPSEFYAKSDDMFDYESAETELFYSDFSGE